MKILEILSDKQKFENELQTQGGLLVFIGNFKRINLIVTLGAFPKTFHLVRNPIHLGKTQASNAL